MKKTTLAFALCALGAIAGQPAWAQADAHPGYLDSSSGVVRSGTGLCWHTGSWMPGQAIAGCDAVAAAETSVVVPVVEAPKREDLFLPGIVPLVEKTELDALVHFAFDRAELTAQGKAVVDAMVAKALADNGRVSVAIVTGHADRIGAAGYNHELALRRASAVAQRLVSRGVPAVVQKIGEKGQSQPIVDCAGAVSRATIACLAPNRRVEVVIMVERASAR